MRCLSRAAATIALLWIASALSDAQTPRATFGLITSTDLGTQQPAGAAVADFNRDGHPDVIVASKSAPFADVNVFTGDGTGVLSRSGGFTFFQATAVATADFNGDSAHDTVVTQDVFDKTGVYGDSVCGSLVGIAIFLGPQMSSGRCIATVPRAVAVQTGDFDRDGRPDIAVVSASAQGLVVYSGLDFVTFGVTARNIPGSDVLATSMAAPVDLNGDGKLDLVVGHSAGVKVFLGNGDGSFAAVAANAGGASAAAVAVGDLNGDGRPDIVSVEATGGRLIVASGAGNGTFTPQPVATIGSDLSDVAVADIDGDGRRDIVVVDRGAARIRIFYGSGSGAFVADPPLAVGVRPRLIAIRDWDADGDLDLAVIDENATGLNAVAWIALHDGGSPIDKTPPIVTVPASITVVGVDATGAVVTFKASAVDNIDGVLTPRCTPPSGSKFAIGQTIVICTATDSHGNTGSASFAVTVTNPPAPPSVTIVAPTSGEIVTSGTPYTIRWTATAGTYAIGHFDVRFSSDGGVSTVPIAECTNLAASSTACRWNSPAPLTETAVILIDAVPTTGSVVRATSARFAVRAATSTTLPSGWFQADVGRVSAAGSATFGGTQFDGGAFTSLGSGTDIWGTADAFHYAWVAFSGDFEVNVQVSSLQNVSAWAKAGIMIRETATDPGSRHASLFVTSAKGIAFQRRPVAGGTSVHTAGPLFVAPVWLRMVRVADRITAYYRKNPIDRWTLVGSQTLAGLPATVNVGLAVTSHADGTLATAKFAGFRLAALQAWTGAAVGAASGSSTNDDTTFSVSGMGADVWGTSDAFYFVSVPWSGAGQITVRMQSVQFTHAWAKAGVMIRESLASGSKHAFAFVTPGKGVSLQYRNATSGTSASAANVAGAAPVWLRIRRLPAAGGGASIDSYSAWYSTDGVIWHVLGSVSFNMTQSAALRFGIAVTSHNSSATAAILDSVRIEP